MDPNRSIGDSRNPIGEKHKAYTNKCGHSNRNLGKILFENNVDILFSWTNLRSKTCLKKS